MFKKPKIDKTLHDTQLKMMKYAEELARINGVELNYDFNSMYDVDKILANLAKELKKERISNFDSEHPSEVAQGYAETFGCYIVEVIERAQGKGKWDDHDEFGPVYKFTLSNGIIIYPMQWCAKKLANPKNYSIQKTFEHFVPEK